MTPQANQPSADVPEAIAGDPLLVLVWQALRFANWATGQGICPNEDQGVREPEEFLMDYSIATDEEDWETLPDRLPLLLADRQAREEARDGGGWRVKPLEWDEPERGLTMRRAVTPLGTYSTWTHFEAEGRWFWSLRPRMQFAVLDEGAGRSEAEVHGKAQAHYEARIRSAIEPSSVEGDSNA